MQFIGFSSHRRDSSLNNFNASPLVLAIGIPAVPGKSSNASLRLIATAAHHSPLKCSNSLYNDNHRCQQRTFHTFKLVPING
jgi:hypothetical protein